MRVVRQRWPIRRVDEDQEDHQHGNGNRRDEVLHGILSRQRKAWWSAACTSDDHRRGKRRGGGGEGRRRGGRGGRGGGGGEGGERGGGGGGGRGEGRGEGESEKRSEDNPDRLRKDKTSRSYAGFVPDLINTLPQQAGHASGRSTIAAPSACDCSKPQIYPRTLLDLTPSDEATHKTRRRRHVSVPFCSPPSGSAGARHADGARRLDAGTGRGSKRVSEPARHARRPVPGRRLDRPGGAPRRRRG